MRTTHLIPNIEEEKELSGAGARESAGDREREKQQRKCWNIQECVEMWKPRPVTAWKPLEDKTKKDTTVKRENVKGKNENKCRKQ